MHSRVPRADGTWCSTGPQSQSHNDGARSSQNLGVGLLLTKASPNNTPNGISDNGLLWEHWDPYNESPKIKWTQQNRIYISYSESLEILIICLGPGIIFIYCSSQIYFSAFNSIFRNWDLILSFKVLGIFSVGFLSRQDPIKKKSCSYFRSFNVLGLLCYILISLLWIRTFFPIHFYKPRLCLANCWEL